MEEQKYVTFYIPMNLQVSQTVSAANHGTELFYIPMNLQVSQTM